MAIGNRERKIGDIIPFFHDGSFYLFYLDAERGDIPSGCSWNLMKTNDLKAFQKVESVIPHGNKTSQDFYVFTGSVIKHGDSFEAFYTAHNMDYLNEADRNALGKDNRVQETIRKAVSEDLVHWRKDQSFELKPDSSMGQHDFRDPFLFMDESGLFHMLVSTRKREGPFDFRGQVSEYVSKDLNGFTLKEKPFMGNWEYFEDECPDLFRIGDWWYLVYSEFSERFVTRYKMSRSKEGPWETPTIDYFDNRHFYAGKTASDGTNRYLFGWNATISDGKYDWGGDMTIHQLVQHPDGTLGVKCPDALKRDFSTSDKEVSFVKEEGFVSKAIGPSAASFDLSFRFDISEATSGIEITFDGNEDMFSGYRILLDVASSRMLSGKRRMDGSGITFDPESERACKYSKLNKVECQVENGIVRLYLNDDAAFSGRYAPTGNGSCMISSRAKTATIREITYQILSEKEKNA